MIYAIDLPPYQAARWSHVSKLSFGMRMLPPARQKFQGVRKVRLDFPVGLILEKLRVCEAQRNNESPSGAFK